MYLGKDLTRSQVYIILIYFSPKHHLRYSFLKFILKFTNKTNLTKYKNNFQVQFYIFLKYSLSFMRHSPMSLTLKLSFEWVSQQLTEDLRLPLTVLNCSLWLILGSYVLAGCVIVANVLNIHKDV